MSSSCQGFQAQVGKLMAFILQCVGMPFAPYDIIGDSLCHLQVCWPTGGDLLHDHGGCLLQGDWNDLGSKEPILQQMSYCGG
eukprot:12930575-Prorocentrum_lima.AAC.1